MRIMKLGEITRSDGGGSPNTQPGGGGAVTSGSGPGPGQDSGGGAAGGSLPGTDGDELGRIMSAAGRAGKLKRLIADTTSANPNQSPMKDKTRSPVSFTRPIVRPERAFFQEIPVVAPVITASTHAWYGLRRINVPYDVAGEISVAGIYARLLSPDSAGAGDSTAGSAIAWGTLRGTGAAIVIGRNLPIQLGAWTSGVCYVPGLDDGAANALQSTLNSATSKPPNNYISVIGFPPGTWDSATGAGAYAGPIPIAGGSARVRVNETLDVAFVCKRATVNGVTGTICGLADITMYIAPLDIAEPWQS